MTEDITTPQGPSVSLGRMFEPELLQRADVPCQRWRDGRASWVRPAQGAPFDARRFSVDVVPAEVAKAFVRRHHYSSSVPAARLSFGLFGAGARLVGVAMYSQPMTQSVVPAHCGVDPSQGIELGRLVCLDGDAAPANSESFFVARAMQGLAQELPQLRAVVSYCDPVARYGLDGRCVMPGHVGSAYQAGNARHVGMSSPRTLCMLADGTVLSPRTLSKIRLQEVGARPAEQRLVALGARPRAVLEDPAAWLAEVLASPMVRRFRHPGNYAYVFALGTPAQRRATKKGFPPARAYPKKHATALPGLLA